MKERRRRGRWSAFDETVCGKSDEPGADGEVPDKGCGNANNDTVGVVIDGTVTEGSVTNGSDTAGVVIAGSDRAGVLIDGTVTEGNDTEGSDTAGVVIAGR